MLIFSVLSVHTFACVGDNVADLHRASKRSLSEINTCGLGRTRFIYESVGDVVPTRVYFADGGTLERQANWTSWEFVKDGVRMPWHGDVV